MRHWHRVAWSLLAALLCACIAVEADAQDKVVIFAAASLTESLTAAADAYAGTGKPKPIFSFGASSTLARQIENGAPAGLFVSADEQWMDYLADRNLIVPPSRVSFLTNTLVLVTPADRPLTLTIGNGFPLARLLGNGKLALADPDSVPAGRYAKAALEKYGVWGDVEKNVVRGDNVRVALSFVERGEAAAGIVYATDAILTPKVSIAGTFPVDSHPPISYPLAVVAGHDSPDLQAFRAFLLGDVAKEIYRKYGFGVK